MREDEVPDGRPNIAHGIYDHQWHTVETREFTYHDFGPKDTYISNLRSKLKRQVAQFKIARADAVVRPHDSQPI